MDEMHVIRAKLHEHHMAVTRLRKGLKSPTATGVMEIRTLRHHASPSSTHVI
jgi:hypothetical protein